MTPAVECFRSVARSLIVNTRHRLQTEGKEYNVCMIKNLRHLVIMSCAWLVLALSPETARAGTVAVIHLKDTIQPVSADFLQQQIGRINRDRAADLIVIELDTPGGLLASTRDITAAIMDSTIPVSVFVSPAGARAASAGFFILLASDFPAMSPGTNAGAAHPVSAIPFMTPQQPDKTGKDQQQAHPAVQEKAVEDTAAFIRSIAEKRGRPVAAAEEAVRSSKAYSADECLQLGLVDYQAETIEDLVMSIAADHPELGLDPDQAPTLKHLIYSLRERFLSRLASPEIIYLLFLAGIIGVFIELKTPGTVFPGLFGAICLILFFFATRLIPVNMAGMLLILLAIILFALEFKIVSYGFLTIGGVVSMIIGTAMLFRSDLPGLSLGIGNAVLIAVAMMAWLFVMLWLVVKAHQHRPMAGEEMLIGMEGTAVTGFERKGKVFVNGEYWDALTDTPVEKDQPVQVVGIRNMILIVQPQKEA